MLGLSQLFGSDGRTLLCSCRYTESASACAQLIEEVICLFKKN